MDVRGSKEPGALLRSVHARGRAASPVRRAASPLGVTPLNLQPTDDEPAAVPTAGLSARSLALTERAHAHLTSESPRAAEVRRRAAERVARGAPSPRRRSPRERRMTTDEFIEHLGIASPDATPRVRPSWDRSPLDQRAAWVAEHSVRAPSSFGAAAGGTSAAERSLKLGLLSAHHHRSHHQQPALSEGVPSSPRSSQLYAFLDDADLAHLAADFAEHKYITPMDLIDAEDAELLGLIYKLRHRLAMPERRRFIRAIVSFRLKMRRKYAIYPLFLLEHSAILGGNRHTQSNSTVSHQSSLYLSAPKSFNLPRS